jgi:hypothetical protein
MDGRSRRTRRGPDREHTLRVTRLGIVLAVLLVAVTVSSTALDRGSVASAARRDRRAITSSTTSSTTSTTVPTTVASGSVLIADSFSRPDGLITNEYAYWNRGAPDAINDAVWQLTSGSLFARSGTAWSGRPDDIAPNATSSNGTDSAILRMVSLRRDLSSVAVSFVLRRNGFTSTPSTPAVPWDGEHVFLRYQSETSLYAVSFDRRDGTTAIKKKVSGGTSNGGTYYTLASGTDVFPAGAFHRVLTSIADNADGSATIRLTVDGVAVLSATDAGVGGPVITQGGVGLRADNADITVDDLVVTSA